MCFDYDDTCDLYEEQEVKTRKPHRCAGCRKIVPSGQRATVCSGLFDHSWFRYYVCDRCERLRLGIAAKEIQEGCPWHTAWIAIEELREYEMDHREFGEPVDLLRLRTLDDCRRYVNDLWERQTGRVTMC